jgi:hypothetical protein
MNPMDPYTLMYKNSMMAQNISMPSWNLPQVRIKTSRVNRNLNLNYSRKQKEC